MSKDRGSDQSLSVVIPTYNEVKNIPILIDKLKETLSDLNFEIIVVDDDSPDKTWAAVQQISKDDKRIRLIRRVDTKGLSSAVTTGMLSSTGDVIAVMDADMQHDETILPDIFKAVVSGECDICVGSREAPGGSYGNWSLKRKVVSYSAKLLAHITLGSVVRDPMSGYFAVSRTLFQNTVEKVNPSGFKILLEFIARADSPKVKEIGYNFRTRIYGETKLNATVAIEYLLALLDLRFGWLIPNRFVKFAMVGVTGSLVNFLGFAISQAFGVSISLSVFIGVQLAILWTYFGNNFFTFSPIIYRGASYVKGMVFYQFASVYGLVVQLSIVHYILTSWPAISSHLWATYLAYMVGVSFAALGNYFIHTTFTWNKLGFKLLKPTKARGAQITAAA